MSRESLVIYRTKGMTVEKKRRLVMGAQKTQIQTKLNFKKLSPKRASLRRASLRRASLRRQNSSGTASTKSLSEREGSRASSGLSLKRASLKRTMKRASLKKASLKRASLKRSLSKKAHISLRRQQTPKSKSRSFKRLNRTMSAPRSRRSPVPEKSLETAYELPWGESMFDIRHRGT